MSCVFCDDVRRAGDVLAEDDRLWIVLHEDWAVRGHAMIVWKKHVENVADLTAGEYAYFAAAQARASRHSSSVASGRTKRRLSRTVPAKRFVSCVTTPTRCRRSTRSS